MAIAALARAAAPIGRGIGASLPGKFGPQQALRATAGQLSFFTKTNFRDVGKKMVAERRKMETASVWALNELAFTIARKHLPKASNRAFEGGATAWTKRGFKYIKAKRGNPVATIYIDEIQWEYMRFMVKSNAMTRHPDRQKIGVPTKNLKRKSKFGHIPKSEWERYQDKSKYFFGKPKGFDKWKKKPGDGVGVWERYGRKTKSGGQKIRMLVALKDEAKYPDRYFDYYGTVNRYAMSRSRGFMSIYNRKMRSLRK
jgi:hypothetical protein